MRDTLSFITDGLSDVINKFPNIKSYIDECINEIVRSGMWDSVQSDVRYMYKNKPQRTLTVKHVCRSGKSVTKYTQEFKI